MAWACALLALICLVTFIGIWSYPQVLLQAGAALAGLPSGAVQADHIALRLPGRVEVQGLTVAPLGPARLSASADALECDLPSPLSLLRGRIELGEVSADGLWIAAAARRSTLAAGTTGTADSAASELGDVVGGDAGGALTLTASSLTLTNSALRLAEDPPLKAVDVEGISGHLTAVRWQPARRWILGEGELGADSLTIGRLQLTRVSLPEVSLTGDAARFGGALAFGEAVASVSGAVEGLTERASVTLTATLEGARVEHLFAGATGHPGPLSGPLDGELTLHAGGELGRADAWWDARFALRETSLALGEDLGGVRRALIKLTPWFAIDDGALTIPDLHGQARFGGGWVELTSLHYKTKTRRDGLQIWGAARDGESRVQVRTLPARGDRGGLGLIVEGRAGDTEVRLSRPGELSTPPALGCEHE